MFCCTWKVIYCRCAVTVLGAGLSICAPGILSVLCTGEGTVECTFVTTLLIKTITFSFQFQGFFLYKFHQRSFCIVDRDGEWCSHCGDYSSLRSHGLTKDSAASPVHQGFSICGSPPHNLGRVRTTATPCSQQPQEGSSVVSILENEPVFIKSWVLLDFRRLEGLIEATWMNLKDRVWSD